LLVEQIVDIYGPEGIRSFIRATLQLSHSYGAVRYRVHELKNPRRGRETSVPEVFTKQTFGEVAGGQDMYPDENGIYTLVSDEKGLSVRAANMVHSIPCVGFVIDEPPKAGRLKTEYVMPEFMKNIVSV
jgi:ribonuclease Z